MSLHALSSCLTIYIHDNLRSVDTEKAFIDLQLRMFTGNFTSLRDAVDAMDAMKVFCCERTVMIQNSLMTSQSETVMVRKILRVSNPVT